MAGEEISGIRDYPFAFNFYSTTRHLDLEKRKKWWEAYAWYRRRVDDPERWFVRRLEAGQMAMLYGKRVMHARKEYRKTSPEQGRTIMTAYCSFSNIQNLLLLPDGIQQNLLELHLGE